MKRLACTAALVLLLCLGLAACTPAAEVTPAPTPTAGPTPVPTAEPAPTPELPEATPAQWTRLDANSYLVITAEDHAPILIQRLQDADIQNIKEKLIDTEREPDTAAAEAAANDPDAFLPYNMLPDGRFLLDGWEALQKQLMEDAVAIRSFEPLGAGRFDNALRALPLEKTTVSTPFSDLELTKIGVGEDAVIVPRDADSVNIPYAIAPDGSYTVFAFEAGMVRVDSRGTAKTVTPSAYRGKTYEQLNDEAIGRYGNTLFWNGQVALSPDGRYAAYVSNKEDLTNSWDLFVLDMDMGEEKLIGNDPLMRYGVIQWLDEKHVLCDKSYGGKYTTVIVNIAGNEVIPDFAFDNPWILGARGGVIAYGNEENNIICFARFNGAETLEEIGRIKLDGTFRIRPGIDLFSPDGTRFAFISVPDSAPGHRDAAVYDFAAGTVQVNETAPYGTKDQACITEFYWLDEDTLLTSVEDTDTGTISSWLYRVPS